MSSADIPGNIRVGNRIMVQSLREEFAGKVTSWESVGDFVACSVLGVVGNWHLLNLLTLMFAFVRDQGRQHVLPWVRQELVARILCHKPRKVPSTRCKICTIIGLGVFSMFCCSCFCLLGYPWLPFHLTFFFQY